MNDEGTQMLRFITSVFFYFFILFQTTSLGEEGEPEHLMVPETQEASNPNAETDISSEEVSSEVVEVPNEAPMKQEPLASNDTVEPVASNEYNDVENIAEPIPNNEQENIEQNHEQDDTQNPSQQLENTEQYRENVPMIQSDTPDASKESQEPEAVEGPTEAELEVLKAEESELRDVGAGEEPSME